MAKKDFQKRVGQLYAQGIQYGYSDEQLLHFIEQTLEAFLAPKKDEFYQKKEKQRI